MPTITGPGAGIAVDVEDLDVIRDRVVMPVIEAMLEPSEFEKVTFRWGLDLRERRTAGEDLYACVHAVGETSLYAAIWFPGPVDDEPEQTRGDMAYRLADQMEDWICECVAWGELRDRTIFLP